QDRGVHTFFGASAITLATLGARTITATDTAAAAVNGNGNVTVVAPAAVARLRVDIIGLAPSTVPGLPAVRANETFSIIVTAVDANGSVPPAYTGTVNFTSTDAGAGVVLPNPTVFAAGDLGQKVLTGVKLVTRGRTATITATDNRNAAITGSGRVIV